MYIKIFKVLKIFYVFIVKRLRIRNILFLVLDYSGDFLFNVHLVRVLTLHSIRFMIYVYNRLYQVTVYILYSNNLTQKISLSFQSDYKFLIHYI